MPPNPLSVHLCSDTVLEVRGLRIEFATPEGPLPAVRDVSFSLARGRTLALVGESGCGKSVTSYALLRLLQPPGRIAGGAIHLHSSYLGVLELAAMADDDPRLYEVRGGAISMIFQEPMTALSPVHRVGDQIAEAILLHRPVAREVARRLAVEMLGKVGLTDPERSYLQYPHELSGGMRQRIVIAMALVCRPEVLVADEPTTALDVTIQAQILRLIRTLQQEIGCAVFLITHDLGVVAEMADEVAVMYLGRIVEQADVRTILKRPRHPYTAGLLRSLPAGATGGRLEPVPGAVPSLGATPPGCPFHPRCRFAQPGRCDAAVPPLRPVGSGHVVACVRAEEIGVP